MVIALAAVVTFNINFNVSKSETLSLISLANVEALAQSENGGAGGITCRSNPVEGAAHAYDLEVSCSTCSYRPLKSWSGLSKCYN